jgi:RHS repeat-associated protein
MDRPKEITMIRKLSLALIVVVVVLSGCGIGEVIPPVHIQGSLIPVPRPGVATIFVPLMVPVPGGRVNTSGGNLHVSRSDMMVDTRVSEWAIGTVWNSANGFWRWNFDSTLIVPRPGQPPIFTDPTGYSAFLKGVEYDEPIPGTHWVSHDETSVRTLGGLIHHFDGNGLLESVNWISADYPSIRFERDASLRVATVEQCTDAVSCSALYTMTFDGQGRIDTITDLAGREVRYTYDGTSMRIASARDPLDVENGWPGTRYEYDPEQRLVAIVNSHDERVEYSYSGSTRAVKSVKQVGEGDPVTSFVYGSLDQIHTHAETTVTSPLGKSFEFRFDTALRIKHYINPDGEKWKWIWTNTDLRSLTSPAGLTRNFSVSVDRTVLTQTFASGNVVTTTFAPSPAENRDALFTRPILQIDDNLGLYQSRTYSPEGYLESITNGAGDATTFALTANEDLTITTATGIATTYSNRGNHGKYLTETRGSKIVTNAFDLVGNLLAVDGLLDEETDLYNLSIGQGGLVSRSYNGNRNISGIMLEDGGGGTSSEVQVESRTDGQKIAIRRPYGGDTEYQYDDLGRLIEERTWVDGGWVATSFEYSLNGQNTAVLKPNGMGVRLTYRDSGQLASTQFELDWSDPSEFDQRVEFDYLNGRRIAIRDSAHGMTPEQYSYDATGMIEEVRYPDGEKITYEYDIRGRSDRKQYWRPDDSLLRTFDYEFNLSNQRIRVIEDGTEILNTTIVDGRIDQMLYGNGVEVVNTFDASTGALSGFTAVDIASQVVASMSVNTTVCNIVLPASRCTVEQTDSLIGIVATSYAEYQVEDQGSERLIADSYGVTSPVDGFYDYDELSNLRQTPTGNFIYNAERNRLLEIEDGGETVVDYVYDDAGYIVERNGVLITWSGMGLLTSVGTGLVIEWDSMGRKISSGDTNWKYGGEITEDELGNDQQLDLGWVVCNLDDSTHEYRLFDFRGNAKLMLNDAGEVTAHHHYSGYAQTSVDGSDPSELGFAGGTHADEFVIIGARIYDPLAARFLSQDPVPQVVNQYSYTLGNPIRFWDPSGMQEIPATWDQTSTTLTDPTNLSVDGGIHFSFNKWGISFGFDLNIGKPASTQADTYTAPVAAPPDLVGGGVCESIDPVKGQVGELKGGDGAGVDFTPIGGPEAAPFSAPTVGNGSVGRNGNGPGRGRGGGKRTPTYNSGTFCGLGFELVPVLVILFAIRGRRRFK